MRRSLGLFMTVSMWMGLSSSAKAQFITAGDPAGFGRPGISNTLGYNIQGPKGIGYMPGLYYPTDTQGPGVYYSPVFNGLNGTPRPDIANRGFVWSPPWSANYRQGQPRRRLFALSKND